MTKEEIEKLEPSKERVDKQLDELYVKSKLQRDCFHKGVMFAKGYLKQDIDLLIESEENNKLLQDTLASSNKTFKEQDERIEALLKALDGLLNNNDYTGCPMCDNGKLRDSKKEHWDDCNWNNARKLYKILSETETNKSE